MFEKLDDKIKFIPITQIFGLTHIKGRKIKNGILSKRNTKTQKAA